LQSPGDGVDYVDASVANADFDLNGFAGKFPAYQTDYDAQQAALAVNVRSETIRSESFRFLFCFFYFYFLRFLAASGGRCRATALIGNRQPRVPPGAPPPQRPPPLTPMVAPPIPVGPPPLPGQWQKGGVN
jgi:hypothetical protein